MAIRRLNQQGKLSKMYEEVSLQHWYWVEGSRMRAEREGEILRAIAQNNGLLIPKAKMAKRNISTAA